MYGMCANLNYLKLLCFKWTLTQPPRLKEKQYKLLHGSTSQFPERGIGKDALSGTPRKRGARARAQNRGSRKARPKCQGIGE